MTQEWITATEAVKRSKLAHSALLQMIGTGRLIGTSVDGHVLLDARSVDRLVRAMAPAGSSEGARS